MIEIILFLIIGFVASAFSSTFGVGAAMILIPFSTFLLPVKQVIALAAVYFLAVSISKAVIFRKDIDWKLAGLIILGAVPFTLLGSILLAELNTDIITKTLGGIILFYVINDYFKLTKNVKLNNFGIVGASAVYGFFSGIVGDGSAIKAALLDHLEIRKEKFVALMATSAVLISLIKSIVYTKFNLLTSSDIPLALGLVVVAIGGAYTGKHFIAKVSDKTFKNVILIVLIVIAFRLLIF